MATCRICGFNYVETDADDRKQHAGVHKKLATGIQPRIVRDFYKAYGWAVAHNDGGLKRLSERDDSELGKLAIVYSWWNRALQNNVPQKEFDAYMKAHLEFVDAKVSGKDLDKAYSNIQRWGQFDG